PSSRTAPSGKPANVPVTASVPSLSTSVFEGPSDGDDGGASMARTAPPRSTVPATVNLPITTELMNGVRPTWKVELGPSAVDRAAAADRPDRPGAECAAVQHNRTGDRVSLHSAGGDDRAPAVGRIGGGSDRECSVVQLRDPAGPDRVGDFTGPVERQSLRS